MKWKATACVLRKAQPNYVAKSLRELRHIAEKEQFASIALPRLATGVGGLDWAEVKPLIERQLGDLDIPVLVYAIYHKGVQALEPLM